MTSQHQIYPQSLGIRTPIDYIGVIPGLLSESLPFLRTQERVVSLYLDAVAVVLYIRRFGSYEPSTYLWGKQIKKTLFHSKYKS